MRVPNVSPGDVVSWRGDGHNFSGAGVLTDFEGDNAYCRVHNFFELVPKVRITEKLGTVTPVDLEKLRKRLRNKRELAASGD